MDPIVTVLRIGSVERVIGSYGVMLALATLVGGAILARAAARARMDVGASFALLGFVASGAAAGGFSLFVLVEWVRTGTPLDAIRQPGLVFYGAPIVGGIAFFATARWLGLPAGKLADLALPALPTAHAVGRLGCFLGGCCYGAPWDGPFAVTYTNAIAPAAHPPVPRHAVPLYEALGLLLLALVFALVPPSRVGSGRRLAVYFACYGCLRFLVELARGDLVRGVFFGGALSTSQILSIALVLGSLAFLVVRPRPHAASPTV